MNIARFAIFALLSLSVSGNGFGQQSRGQGSANATPAWAQLAKLSSSDHAMPSSDWGT
jgi:hypothetical protein